MFVRNVLSDARCMVRFRCCWWRAQNYLRFEFWLWCRLNLQLSFLRISLCSLPQRMIRSKLFVWDSLCIQLYTSRIFCTAWRETSLSFWCCIKLRLKKLHERTSLRVWCLDSIARFQVRSFLFITESHRFSLLLRLFTQFT